MARINECKNVKAFLDMLAFSEGTAGKGDDGYNKIVDGIDSPGFFSDYSSHPNVIVTVNRKGLKSSAAGRYQFLFRHWAYYKSLLNLPDFGPVSQDQWAIKLIKERSAFSDVVRGDIKTAIRKCSNIWASLPGAGYGQPEHKLDLLLVRYTEYGGKST